jgi:deoxyribodipyrimidine photolyase
MHMSLLYNSITISGSRAQFLIECLGDLKQNLKKKGLDLLVRHGRPEEILPSIAKAVSAHTVGSSTLNNISLNI